MGFARYGQFLLAPVFRRDDRQEYFEAELGLIKHTIEFRNLSDITSENDIDAKALLMPQLVRP